MFGIGPYEMLIILALGLMLFSPRELPSVLRGIAKFWGSIRRTADEFRDAIMQDEDLNQIKTAYTETADELRGAELQARRELMKARMDMRRAEAKLADAAKDTEAALKGVVPAQDEVNTLGPGEDDLGELPEPDLASAPEPEHAPPAVPALAAEETLLPAPPKTGAA